MERRGLYEEDGLQPVAESCRAAVRLAAGVLAEAGHEPVETAPPAAREVRSLCDAVIGTELAVVALPHLGGREAELSPPVRGMVGDLSGFGPDLGAYLEAARRLSELEDGAREWLERTPVALCPVTPVLAPPAAEGIASADGRPMNPGGKLTLCTYANALGLPAVSVPVARDEASGLPVGVQLIGRPGRDADLLALAGQLEQALGGFVDPEQSPASALRAG